MSKYKVGDKVVMEITDKVEVMEEPWYILSDATSIFESHLDKAAEPLSDYTEQARAEGQNEAWELARKITCQPINGGFNRSEFEKIFGYGYISDIFEKYKYTEAATKVVEWEKTKAKILVKAGDVLENIYDSNIKCIVTNLYPNNKAYLVFDDGTAGMNELDNFKKTGRHIDVNSFLKQIGGEQE